MKKVYCLYRESNKYHETSDQQSKDDIPMQRQACHEFIAEHKDWQFYDEQSEKGVSGFKVSATKRDVLQNIQHEAMQGKFDVLLVFMFDRLGRRDDETPFVVEWFVRQGIEVWSVKEGQQRFDSHVDKLTNYIRFWQASGESIKTSMRTKTALGQIVQEGRFRGGGVPYGYKIERQGRINKKGYEVYDIFTDEYESGVVKTIFDMYANKGYGTQTLSTRLYEMGIVNRSGHNFHPSTILNMIKNPTYLGILRSCESRSEPFEHLRLVDDLTWERTQELIKERSQQYEEKRKKPKMIKGDSLLSGNIFCGHCGARLTLTSAGKAYSRADGTVMPHRYLRYVCYNHTRYKGRCDGQTGYAAKTIDDCVEKVLLEAFGQLQRISNDEVIKKQFASQMKEHEAKVKRAKKLLASRTSELADLKGEVVKVIRGTSKWNMELLNELIENTESEIRALQAEMDASTKEYEHSETIYQKIKTQYSSYLDWADVFADSDMATKKMIASHMLDRVAISEGNKIEIDFNVSLEQFLNEAQSENTFDCHSGDGKIGIVAG